MTAASFGFLYIAGYLLTLAWFMDTLLKPNVQKVIQNDMNMNPAAFQSAAAMACILWPLIWITYLPLNWYISRKSKP
jgi:cell division septal protein FtsQ